MAPTPMTLERPKVLPPADAELLQLAQRSLQAWAGLGSRPAARPQGAPASDLIRASSPVPGRRGLVAVAASAALGAALAVAATGDPNAGDFGAEALQEYCRLIGERMIGAQLPGKLQPLDPAGEAWPDAAPGAAVALDVGGQRLELRAWDLGVL